ncbi:hypothetical protein ACUNWD_06445 [Sunxiuqinia sp. A32]|uniref:hypothetical protein n=1 Tax=Sunxiuqinia sp. A32 TaxID=3461496 RepID=UPI004045C95A
MKNNDQQFKELMKSYQSAKAPVDFTKSVMDQIQVEKTVTSAYQPIFGKWFLKSMMAALAGLFIYVLFSASVNSAADSTYINAFSERLPKVDFSGMALLKQQVADLFSSVPSVVLFTLIAATLLLILDLLILKRRKHTIAS